MSCGVQRDTSPQPVASGRRQRTLGRPEPATWSLLALIQAGQLLPEPDRLDRQLLFLLLLERRIDHIHPLPAALQGGDHLLSSEFSSSP
jgi:hypothetical protein